ncbi:cell division ATP-binding protein FtsE [Kurthia sibirica]|nr:ATP-binding cassette domain-containing protein [Kurthia sibirica]GEK34881.1 glutamine ABC transporter ATP-binding protein [Kurthia sibirica]
MLEFRNITKNFGESVILHEVNAIFHKGSFHFICGESGSGKSTILKLINQEIAAEKGDILWQGQPLKSYEKFKLRRQIGVVFQSFELIHHMTVLENILLAGRALGKNRQALLQRAMKLLTRVGLNGKIEAYPEQLSGGQMQRVAIVRAILNKPLLLLADEPTGNLDRKAASDVMNLLYELHREEQMTMIVVTHSEEVLAQFTQAQRWYVKEGDFYEQE